jgi:four helix bundle protein
MFLALKHTQLDIYDCSKQFVLLCYKMVKLFPLEEKYNLTSQLKRASLSVHLNLSEGCSRKSEAERKRFFEISRGSLIEVDTIFDIAIELNYCTKQELEETGIQIIKLFQMLSKMIVR